MEAPDLNHATRPRRAIGIVRVGQTGGREGERFSSPGEQRERIQAACERDGLKLIGIHDELDVSGGKPLEHRPGLSAAVAAVENGESDVIAAAFFDRLFRSLSTQAEVVERVETASGQLLAVDVGQGHGRERRSVALRHDDGRSLGILPPLGKGALSRGAGSPRGTRCYPVGAGVNVGYHRREDGTLEADPATVPIARRAFEMRAEGESITQIRNKLRAHGIERSHRGVQVMIASRVYLGLDPPRRK